jgi:hypothetical protein|tara:strand:- start:129 stop:407 length:279 start_codon:yes stop_codon:yes gene_type:complete
VIEDFLHRKKIESPADLELSLEMQAYIVAKHYSVSIKEVQEMSPQQFYQSFTWAMVGRRQEEKAHKRDKQSAKSGGRETVSLDYDFLNREDF